MNGSRNPAASPTSSQPSPARRVDPDADRRRALDRVAASAAPASRPGSSPPAGSAARTASATVAPRPRARRRAPPRPRPSTIPTLTRPPGHRREADVAAVEHDHPRVARPVRARIRDVERQRRRGRRAGGAGRRRRRGRRRTAARRRRRRPAAAIVAAVRRASRARPRRRRTVAPEPDLGARRARPARGAAGRAPTGRARRPAPRASRRRRRSGGSDVPAGVSTRIAGIGRATRCDRRLGEAEPRSAATVAGDVNTPQARQRQAGARSRSTTSPPAPREADARSPRRPARRRRRRRRALGIGRSRSARGDRARGARRTRRRRRRRQPRLGRRAAQLRPACRPGARTAARRAACSRFRGDGVDMSQAPTQKQPAADEVVDDDAEPGDAAELAQERDRVGGLEVVEDERAVGDVERAVGVGERAPVGDREAQSGDAVDAGPREPRRRRGPRRGCRSRSTRSDRPRRAASASSATGMSAAAGPDVEDRRATRRPASSRAIARRLSRVPPSQPVDPARGRGGCRRARRGRRAARRGAPRRRPGRSIGRGYIGAGAWRHPAGTLVGMARPSARRPALARTTCRGRRARRAARGARHPRVRGPRPVLPDAERRRPWHRRRRDPAALPGGAGRIRPGQLARRRHRCPQPDRARGQRRLRPGHDARRSRRSSRPVASARPASSTHRRGTRSSSRWVRAPPAPR